MNFDELTKARETLGLGESSSLNEIKRQYRVLTKEYHPDNCQKDFEICEKKIREITHAYKVINEYITKYKFSFSECEFYRQNPEEQFKKRFQTDLKRGKTF